MKSKFFTLLIISFSFCTDAGDLKEFKISDRSVIFFSVTQSKYDSKDDKEQSELTEILSDFDFYQSEIQSFLIENKIQMYQTKNSEINIIQGNDKNTTYNRKQLDSVVGTIMADQSKKPKLLVGVMTDVNLIKVISEYFGLQPNSTNHQISVNARRSSRIDFLKRSSKRK